MNELPEETTADIVDADGAYDSDALRDAFEQASFTLNIPARKNRKQPRPPDREEYNRRNEVERLVNRIKSLRRVATRYEKLAPMFLATIQITGIVCLLT